MLQKLFTVLLFIGLMVGTMVLAQVVERNVNEIEITGVVEALGDGTINIGGLVIDISSAEIKGVITVGETVKVHVSLDDTGNFVAREAEVVLDDDEFDDLDDVVAPAATEEPGFDDDNDDRREGEFEIVGIIDEIGDGFIVMNGQTILIDSAEIKNELVVGTLVKVHLRNNNGDLVAREVENADDDDQDDDGDNDTWDVTYTIRPGDTLSDIARRSGTTVEEIARMNNIADIRVVVAGTTLILPNQPFDDDDDNSGRGSSDDNRGRSHDDDDDSGGSNSGSGSRHDDDDDNGGSNSGSGSRHDDDDDNGGSNSGSGSRHDDDDDD